MLESTLAIIGLAVYLWATLPASASCEKGTGFMSYIAQILDIVLPDMFCGLIDLVILQNSKVFWAVIAIAGVYFWIRSIVREKTVKVAERLRRLVMGAVNS